MRCRPMRWAVLPLCALLFAACGSGTSGSKPATTAGPINPDSLPSAGTVSATIPLIGGRIDPPYIYGIAADDTAVWVHNAAQGTVVRVDPASNKVVATIPVGHGLGDVVLEAGFVWVSNHDDSTISKIDPLTDQVVDTIALPPPTGFLGVSPGAVWVASHENGGTLRKIDARTDQVVATIFTNYGPSWTAYATGALWICNRDAALAGVTRVDPASSNVLTDVDISTGKLYPCDGIAVADDGVWAELLDDSDNYDVGLVRIDPATNGVINTILLPPSPATSALAAHGQEVWTAKQDLGLFRISAKTHQAVGFLSVPDGVAGVAIGPGAVWALDGGGTLLRITPAP
jgi:streptogramin lyase